MRLLVVLVRLAVHVLLAGVEALFWTRHFARGVLRIGLDAARSTRVLRAGVRCPLGHPIETDPDEATYECGACSFRWRGRPWECPYPECPAPTTSFVNCPICSLSVPNPWRWGH